MVSGATPANERTKLVVGTGSGRFRAETFEKADIKKPPTLDNYGEKGWLDIANVGLISSRYIDILCNRVLIRI